jgi:hypothetical protein
MFRLFRDLVICVIAACLICSPLFSFKAASAPSTHRIKSGKLPPNNLAVHEPNTLLVRFHPDSVNQAEYIINTVARHHQRLRGPSGVVKLTLKDDRDLNETLDLLRQLNGAVEWVEPNYIVKRAGLDKSTPAQTKLKARRSTHRSTPVVQSTIIAVIDSGIDLRHRAFKHRLWLNDPEKSGAGSYDDDLNGFVDDLRGWNFVADNNDVSDDSGHGTQVAGIIASQISKSRSSNSQSIRILPLKTLNQSGAGTVADIVEAMDYAIARRAAVINCSFGSPAFSHAMLEAVKRAETAGIVVAAAAGNRGKSLSDSPFYPASYRTHQTRNLISVAATNRDNLLAGFSNYSADIAAPGESIRTAHRGNSYVRLTGTSASAGFVAATAGLLKSIRGFVSAQTIRETILKSALESFDLKGKVASKGTVNAAAALSLFTRNDKNITPGKTKTRSPRARKAVMQSGSNLDTMRANSPQPPNAYQQTGTLPSAGYTDPKPTNTANFNSYLTRMSLSGNAMGVAGGLPLQSVDPTAGSAHAGGWSYNLDSRNYNFTAPVLSLPGRAGMSLPLALSYNSKVWTKDPATGTTIFNGNHGFPAPGWSLGFGAIQWSNGVAYLNSVTGKYSCFYVAPDGTRHDLAYNSAINRMVSYDSSYLEFNGDTGLLRMPNGTQAWFNQMYQVPGSNLLALPTLIKDRNGNQINIYYRTLSNGAVVMDYLIDTAGRRIDFNYQNNRLTSISQNRNGAVFTYVYIDYQPVTIQTNFTTATDPVNINGAQVYFPVRITYPTGVNYRLIYTSYGQLNVIEKWVPAVTGQGAERVVSSTWFDLPSYNPNLPQGDCPSFNFRYEWAENWNGGLHATYQYSYGGPYGHEIIDPTSRRFRVQNTSSTISVSVLAAGGEIEIWTKKDEVIYTSDTSSTVNINSLPASVWRLVAANY